MCGLLLFRYPLKFSIDRQTSIIDRRVHARVSLYVWVLDYVSDNMWSAGAVMGSEYNTQHYTFRRRYLSTQVGLLHAVVYTVNFVENCSVFTKFQSIRNEITQCVYFESVASNSSGGLDGRCTYLRRRVAGWMNGWSRGFQPVCRGFQRRHE